MIFYNRYLIIIFVNLDNKAEYKAQSRAFSKITKQTYNFDLLFAYFSIKVPNINIWSTVLDFGLKPI